MIKNLAKDVFPSAYLVIDTNGTIVAKSSNIPNVEVQGGQGHFDITHIPFTIHGAIATPANSAGDPVSIGVMFTPGDTVLSIDLTGNNGDPFPTGVYVFIF